MADDSVTIHKGIAYANHDGVELAGDLYLPKGKKDAPALVAVHGGGWVQGVRTAFQYWGPYLAARGVAMFSISYRLADEGQDLPAGRAGRAGRRAIRARQGRRVRHRSAAHRAHGRVRRRASRGAGGARRSSGKFAKAYPQDAFASVDAGVKCLIGVYGIYDAVAMWTNYQVQGGRDNNFEKFMGVPPMENRQLYFDASPISYATFANNKIGVLLVTGTQDDLVDPKEQTYPFQLALKQAGFFVRPCIVHGAPHYWMNDPIEEPTSYSGFLAPRLMRFLAEKL